MQDTLTAFMKNSGSFPMTEPRMPQEPPLCDICGKPADDGVVRACDKAGCTYKEPKNTSGKVNRLFRVGGSLFGAGEGL